VKLIHHVLDVDAPGDRVWTALTDRQGLASWWSTGVDGSGDAVGSEIRFTFAGDFHPVMVVTEFDPGRAVGWCCVGGHRNWKDNTFDFELVPLPDGRTRLRFSQHYAVELGDDDYGLYNYNWGYYLESLRRLCVTGTGTPFPAPT
jgi:uncharacterized protein YndB with AHSA1/START domain